MILIECCAESGCYDLPAYLDHLSTRIRQPDFVVGLDSGCGNYNQLWGTTSLRGLVNGVLTVEVLTEGVHSGDASGVVPTSSSIEWTIMGSSASSRVSLASPVSGSASASDHIRRGAADDRDAFLARAEILKGDSIETLLDRAREIGEHGLGYVARVSRIP